MTVGFSVGHAYHDFSMVNPLTDKRSCGHLLTKTLLRHCVYDIWYWGKKIGPN